MQLNDFDYLLPNELIAHFPTPKRSDSRLLTLNGCTGEIKHQRFTDVLDLIEPGDLLIFNDTKVIPARLLGKKQSGGKTEVLVERILDTQHVLAQIRVSKPPRIGDKLYFAKGVEFEVTERLEQFYKLRYQQDQRSILEIIEAIGQIPLPPYIERLPEAADEARYQTIYARHKGSVAAPTAGLHFDEQLMQQLVDKKVNRGYLTLHIGAGTFKPVRTLNILEHQMHAEYFEINQALCEQIELTKAHGNRVIAVGTTSLRALESASQSGQIKPYQGETKIFIYPGYQFNCVDALITNLHLPRSTLLMLVAAFGGYENIMQAYKTAVSASYRFFSYGDAMWISRKN